MKYDYELVRDFVLRRKAIMAEWNNIHPEGITAENLQEAKAFVKRREREIKERRSPPMIKEPMKEIMDSLGFMFGVALGSILRKRPRDFLAEKKLRANYETICRLIEQSIASDWIPSADNINKLPDPLRKYIHDLETNTDPAGIVRENICLKENCKALQILIEQGRPKVSREFIKEWQDKLINIMLKTLQSSEDLTIIENVLHAAGVETEGEEGK